MGMVFFLLFVNIFVSCFSVFTGGGLGERGYSYQEGGGGGGSQFLLCLYLFCLLYTAFVVFTA